MADSVQYKSLPEVLYCKTCNYYTCNKKQIEKHFISSKHIKNSSISANLSPPPTAVEPIAIEDTLPSESDIPLVQPNTPYPLVCECCGKTYKRKRAFLRHQRSKQEEDQEKQNQLETKDNNSSLEDQESDNQSLELISDSDDESSNTECEYITIDSLIIDPLIINHDAAYFIQTFMYSINIVMGISVFINKIFSFFSLKSDDDSD
jgi:hypothetical protein